MADVSHELGSIRHIVDSPLSSKVAMFNKVANQHNASQLLNPFANVDGRASPKPSFSKDEYGKPLAGSLTEMRGQKANIHVCKEMLELCQVINSEGFPDQENPDLRIIFFGDLFNIYNYISDKVVGLLLRARKHKLVDFEGEMLFQRRDDEVPIFLVKPIQEIRSILEAKQEEFRRSVSPAPQPTTVLQDRLKRVTSPRSAPTSKAASPQPEMPKLSTTSSVQSLAAADLKPPTGHILQPVVTKSTESINNIENSIREQTSNSTPGIINATKSIGITNDVIKPVENSITELKIDAALVTINVEVPKEQVIQNVQLSIESNSEKILNIQEISESKMILDNGPTIATDIQQLVEKLQKNEVLDNNNSEVLLNIKSSELEMPVQKESDISVIGSTTVTDITSDSINSIKSQQSSKIGAVENLQNESQSQIQSQTIPPILPAINNSVENTRSNSFIAEVAPQ